MQARVTERAATASAGASAPAVCPPSAHTGKGETDLPHKPTRIRRLLGPPQKMTHLTQQVAVVQCHEEFLRDAAETGVPSSALSMIAPLEPTYLQEFSFPRDNDEGSFTTNSKSACGSGHEVSHLLASHVLDDTSCQQRARLYYRTSGTSDSCCTAEGSDTVQDDCGCAVAITNDDMTTSMEEITLSPTLGVMAVARGEEAELAAALMTHHAADVDDAYGCHFTRLHSATAWVEVVGGRVTQAAVTKMTYKATAAWGLDPCQQQQLVDDAPEDLLQHSLQPETVATSAASNDNRRALFRSLSSKATKMVNRTAGWVRTTSQKISTLPLTVNADRKKETPVIEVQPGEAGPWCEQVPTAAASSFTASSSPSATSMGSRKDKSSAGAVATAATAATAIPLVPATAFASTAARESMTSRGLTALKRAISTKSRSASKLLSRSAKWLKTSSMKLLSFNNTNSSTLVALQ